MWSSVCFLFCPHISCPILHNSVGYGLTILWSCWITILGLEKWECHLWTPRPETHLLRQTRVVYSLAPFLTKASLHLPCVFSSYIYTVLIPHISLISSLLIIERVKERDRRLLLRGSKLPSTDLPSPCTPLAFRPSKPLSKVSFYFLKSFVCS